MLYEVWILCHQPVEPDILIIDEVLAVGDISFQPNVYKQYRDFKIRGVTILFVSHNMSDVEKSVTELFGSKTINSAKLAQQRESLNFTNNSNGLIIGNKMNSIKIYTCHHKPSAFLNASIIKTTACQEG